MNKTNFIKHLVDNYKKYSWIIENGSLITINNGVRIKIEKTHTCSYSVEVAGKYSFIVDESNDMHEEFKKLYDNIVDFIQYKHDTNMEMWMKRFVNGDNNNDD